MFADIDNGALVDAGALVGAFELDEAIGMQASVGIGFNNDFICRNMANNARFFVKNKNAAVVCRLVFHARADSRGFSHKQGNRLTLHVGAHQGAVCVVVFKEGDHCRCNRNELLCGNVHIVDIGAAHLDDLIQPACNDTLLFEPNSAVLAADGGFVCLGNDFAVFLGCGEVNDLVKDAVVLLVDFAVGSFDEAVFIYSCIGCKGVDKADVWAFGRLDRAHSAVMRIVNVANFERCTVAVQTAGAESGKPALMGQLRKRVRLIHELGQLGRTEKLFDGRRYRANIDKVYRHCAFNVLNGHALANNALKPCEADADLVLEQLADGTNAAVAEVVDIVAEADAVGQTHKVTHGGNHVRGQNMPRAEFKHIVVQKFFEFVVGKSLFLSQHIHQHGVVNMFVDADFKRIKVKIACRIDKLVADNADAFFVHGNIHAENTRVLDSERKLTVDKLTFFRKDLSSAGVNNGFGGGFAFKARTNAEFIVEFVSADAGKIVALVKEQRGHKVARTLFGGRFARTLAFVYFDKTLNRVVSGVLFKGVFKAFFLAEQLRICASEL